MHHLYVLPRRFFNVHIQDLKLSQFTILVVTLTYAKCQIEIRKSLFGEHNVYQGVLLKNTVKVRYLFRNTL
jgi:hypothetical protein